METQIMSNKNNKKTTYNVRTADWSMDMIVDENIFDDPHVEACTRCIEEKIKGIANEDDFLVNPVMIVKSKKRKNSKEKVVNTYKVLLNAGLPLRAEMLRKIFFMSTEIDLAFEPLCTSNI